MLKKSITYTDIDGKTVTEEFHFQINKVEVAEREVAHGIGYLDSLKSLTIEKDGAKIIAVFKDFLFSAVGRREGNLFIKNDDIRNQFMFSGAYEAFFMDLISGADSGAAMMAAMLPAEYQEAAKAEVAKLEKKESLRAVPDISTLPPKPPEEQLAALAGVLGPERVEKIANATAENPSNEPTWLLEMRNPTSVELREMGKDEMLLAAQMRETGLLK